MGLFNSKSREIKKKAEWKQGLIHTVVELNDDHMKLITPTATDIIFYKDIIFLEQVTRVVNIRTNVKVYSLTARNIRGGGDKARELQEVLLEKISENK